MKTKITLFLSLLLAACFLYSQTTIPGGDVSGTWNLAGSPYLIDGDVNVPANQHLTIDPGVEIEFQGYYKFEIYGTISAEGTENDTIFVRAKTGSYGHHGFRIHTDPTVTDSSFFSYCHITGGNPSGAFPDNCGGGIGIYYLSNVSIQHCVFENNMAVLGSSPAGGAICTGGFNGEISHCTFIGNTSSYGGAIMLYNGSSARVTDCYFEDNNASEEGGAICIWKESHAQISQNEFINNTTVNYGGAISLYDTCEVLIEENYFKGNIADVGGALIFWSCPNSVVKWNEFIDNEGYNGGAIQVTFDSHPLIKRNLFTSNEAEGGGGALAIMNQCNAVIINNTIASNNALEYGGGIFVYNESCPLQINNIIYNNTAPLSPAVYLFDTTCHGEFFNNDIHYGMDSLGVFTPQSIVFKGNIDEDPHFIGGMPFDFHLLYGSPCIDAGYDTVTYDPDGTISDIGLYFYDILNNITQPKEAIKNIELEIYPNPISNQCAILISILDSKVSDYKLSVYDMRGLLIDQFSISNITYGEKVYRYNASELPTGTYFISLQAGNEVVTKKVIKQ